MLYQEGAAPGAAAHFDGAGAEKHDPHSREAFDPQQLFGGKGFRLFLLDCGGHMGAVSAPKGPGQQGDGGDGDLQKGDPPVAAPPATAARQRKGQHVGADGHADAVKAVQSVVDLPLQIDTSDFTAMEKAMRIYNGKPMINSVNGKTEVMEKVFPLVKKYGGVVVGLTLDENGIPETVEGRIEIAKRIYDTAKKYGIRKKDIVIDPLALTISSDRNSANITLETVRRIKEDFRGNTILGVSNISFGLPCRDNINSAFFTMAMQKGLTSAIINPYSDKMMESYYSFIALSNCENGTEDYIDFASQNAEEKKVSVQEITSLKTAIEKGLEEKSKSHAEELVKTKTALEIINEEIVPALDSVGEKFEKKTLFLPQLLMSANSAKNAFDVIKQTMSGEKQT